MLLCSLEFESASGSRVTSRESINTLCRPQCIEASPLVRYMYHNKGMLLKEQQAGHEPPNTKVKAQKTEDQIRNL